MELLKGVRVLDLSRFVSGPYCSMVLGDLGADVIKVEHAKFGDGTRRWSLPHLGANNPYFLSVNRSKRSIGIDVKHPEGRDLIERLALLSDVLIHNFKYGALDALGLGYEKLAALNPRLIFCEITGYGGEGPYRDLPAFDFPIQAQSGLMSVIGEPKGMPMKVGLPAIDIMTSMQACAGIQAALYNREKTGFGTKISTSLLETALASMTNVISDYIVAGAEPRRWGNGHPDLAPYAAYRTADGWLTVGVATEPQWQRFCEIIGRQDLQLDARFASNPVRLENREALDAEVAAEFLKDGKLSWLDRMQKAGVPCAPINTIPEIIADPHVQAIKMVQHVAHPELDEIRMIRSPLSIEDRHIPIKRAPPTLGQHTDEILSGLLGFDEARIKGLREAGAIS